MGNINGTIEGINKFLIRARFHKRKYDGWPYLLSSIVLFTIEVLIAFNDYSHFIRSYVGDMLVTLLLYCLIRAFLDIRDRRLPWLVFAFAVIIELSQLAGLAEVLGGKPGSVLWVVLGNTFDVKDIVSYFVGCVIAAIILEAERALIMPWWKR